MWIPESSGSESHTPVAESEFPSEEDGEERPGFGTEDLGRVRLESDRGTKFVGESVRIN